MNNQYSARSRLRAEDPEPYRYYTNVHTFTGRFLIALRFLKSDNVKVIFNMVMYLYICKLYFLLVFRKPLYAARVGWDYGGFSRADVLSAGQILCVRGCQKWLIGQSCQTLLYRLQALVWK